MSFNYDSFSEDCARKVAGMIEEAYDFQRCERPNGTFYGTGGTCRKGTPAGDKESGPPVAKSSAPPVRKRARKAPVFKANQTAKGEKNRAYLTNKISDLTESAQADIRKKWDKYGITELEGAAMRFYSENGYIPMNQMMRGIKPPDKSFAGMGGKSRGPGIANEAIVAMETGFKKLPLYEGEVTRGIRVANTDAKAFKVGEIYSDSAYQSTSATGSKSSGEYGTVFGNRAIDYNNATAKRGQVNTALNTMGVTMKISGKHGGRLFEDVSANPYEREVMLPPGQPFRIKKVTRNKVHMIVEMEAV